MPAAERLIAGLLASLALGCSYDYARASRCDNGDQDGDEVDVDCGGSCIADRAGRCGYGMKCVVTSDCDGEVASCERGRCTPKTLRAKWRRLETTKLPPKRYGARLAFNKEGGILFGGRGSAALDDVWLFTNRDGWRERPKGAPGRYYHAQAYDPLRDQIVIAGGWAGGALGSSWIRDSIGAWEQIDLLPASCTGCALVHDGKKLVLWGENTNGNVWVRYPDQPSWTPLPTTAPPPTTFFHGMAYHPDHNAIVVFGGKQQIVEHPGTDQTWILDAESLEWSEKQTELRPHARFGTALAYDSYRHRIVLFGGRYENNPPGQLYNDTWEFDGDQWKSLDAPGFERPPTSFLHAMDYDPVAHQMVLMAGASGGYTPQNETWLLTVLGWPCAKDEDCGPETPCVSNVCCDSACTDGVCNDRDQPGVCTSR